MEKIHSISIVTLVSQILALAFLPELFSYKSSKICTQNRLGRDLSAHSRSRTSDLGVLWIETRFPGLFSVRRGRRQ